MTHVDYTAYLDRIFSQWPDMRRYADTARHEALIAWHNGQRVKIEAVTVTVFDKRNDRMK